MPLSDTAIRAAKGADKAYKLTDGGGLYMVVSPNGSRLWRLDYRYNGLRKTLSFGAYPAVSLADARSKRDTAKKHLADGIDPSVVKKQSAENAAPKPIVTFASVVADYIERMEHDGAAEATITKNRWLLEKLAAPLAQRAINEIKPADILTVLQKVEKSGRLESAVRLRSAISGVFRLAIVTLRAEVDPTFPLVGATKSPSVVNRSAIVVPKRLGWLMEEIDIYDGWPTLRCALLFTALTVGRPGEVRSAEWSEIDLEAARWTIPAQRTKMRRVHEVPLSRQAIDVLHEVGKLTGRDRLVFSSIRDKERPLSENAMNAALRRIGVKKEEHTSHGFRSSFSTLLNERGENAEIIELCLAHVDANKVRSVYNRAQRWPERQAMMQKWADLLDDFRKL